MKLTMFGAGWCGPCKSTRPKAAATAAEAGIPFEYVDIDSGDPRASSLLSVPVLRLYDDAGDVVSEHAGGASLAQVRALLS